MAFKVSEIFTAKLLISICGGLMTLVCILWNLDVHTHLGIPILTEQYLAFQLGMAIFIVYLTSSFRKKNLTKTNILGGIIALIGLCTLLYTSFNYLELLSEQAYRPMSLTIIGFVVIFCVTEGVRRKAGLSLFIIVVLFILYALLAHKMPGMFVGRKMDIVPLLQYVGFDPSAAFGLPLTVASVIVILFVFFGKLLFLAGGGEFFTDLATALTGRTRGGSAKISIVASALFGSISGSAVSNVVTTGIITIPMMRKSGYSDRDAGAIEAIASTGGQLTPPIMGAAAFLMAEFLEISYMTVALAAIIPALLYYFSVFVQVDLIAARDNIKSGEERQSAKEVLRKGWHLIIPFVVLFVALFGFQIDPEKSALVSAVSVIIVGALKSYKGYRINFSSIIDAFVSTGTSLVDLILIVTAAGFVIGILNVTGLGFALTLFLVDSVGGNQFVILIVAALISTLLGMGMPTSGVYVLLAALIVPSMVEAGITPISAHMFILYFGMMSMITPPIALAAFAAAAITKTNPVETGWSSMRIGWASYLIPFAFVVAPELLLEGSFWITIVDTLQAAIGIAAGSIAVVGFIGKKLKVSTRVLLAVLGFFGMPFFEALHFMLYPSYIAAVLAILFIFLIQFKGEKLNFI